MAKRQPPVVVVSEPRTDGCLSVVRVEPGLCVMSTGEELRIKYTKLHTLAEWLCQLCSAVTIRTWATKNGNELIELHRDEAQIDQEPTDPSVF